MGFLLIITNEVAERLRIERYGFGKIILFKTSMYLLGSVLSFGIVFLILQQFDFFPKDMFYLVSESGLLTSVMALVMIFVIIQIIIINFFIQTAKMFGPKGLTNFISGKYYKPVKETRIFLFMDLKSSTTHAEQLGSIAYSQLLKDCFADINTIVESQNAEIYQYVGDEVVITWELREGVKSNRCIELYFKSRALFKQRAEHYIQKYGFIPVFKAGLHGGEVTVTEIGNLKRDIAYHGDVLNTASRIQYLCNEYNQSMLISKTLLDHLNPGNKFTISSMGELQLRGKREKIEVCAIEENGFGKTHDVKKASPSKATFND